MPATDLDKYIVHKEQSGIAELFTKHGEAWFRQREHEYLKSLVSEAKPGTVIACGGGTPCYMGNMQLMNDAGVTVYLEASTAHLLKNMRFTLEMRPLLRDREDINAFLESLLEQRLPFYRQAQYILQTEYISLANFDQIIASCTNRQ